MATWLLWRYCILKIWGIWVSFGCERSCSSPRRVSNFNSNVPQGGIYPHINFERDPLNIFRVRVLTSSGSTGGGDAKTIISPNTSFGDIIIHDLIIIIIIMHDSVMFYKKWFTCSCYNYWYNQYHFIYKIPPNNPPLFIAIHSVLTENVSIT